MRPLAYRTAVEKVVTTLLTSSVKYAPAEGKVTVRTRAAQGALTIYVVDTGVGITPEAQARLGKPFEQSDKTLKNGMRGSGLGLWFGAGSAALERGRVARGAAALGGLRAVLGGPGAAPVEAATH